MALSITHAKVSTAGPSTDPDKVGGDDWNDDHVLTGDYLRKATVTLSSSDILDLYDTPITLVAAPGAGKWLDVHRGHVALDYGSTTYAVVDGVALFADTVLVRDLSSTLTATADAVATFNGLATDFTLAAVANQPLTITDVVGDPTDGDGTLTVTVWYTIEDVPA